MAAPMKYIANIVRLKAVFPVCQFKAIHTSSGPQLFRATTCLSAAPQKKKKRVDMNVIIAKENKKRRKLEKAIERLNAKGGILKPVDEIETDRQLVKTIDQRRREVTQLSFEECEKRALMIKDWSRYKYRHHRDELKAIGLAQSSQDKALKELRNESEELYQMAIQCDEALIPYSFEGPSNTPPIKDYYSPDGEYKDTTPTYDKLIAEVDVKTLKIRI